MEILGKLFGNYEKVKIMRLFLFNPETYFDVEMIAERLKVSEAEVRKEMGILKKIELVRERAFYKDVDIKKGGKVTIEKKKTSGWCLDTNFAYLKPLQSFLIDISPLQHSEIVKRLSKIGKLKTVIVSGIFIQDWESRVDILVVADNLKKGVLEGIIRSLESEIGREIKYSAFETPDFQYRLSMCDKLVRDVLDYPHEKVIDKLNVQ